MSSLYTRLELLNIYIFTVAAYIRAFVGLHNLSRSLLALTISGCTWSSEVKPTSLIAVPSSSAKTKPASSVQ